MNKQEGFFNKVNEWECRNCGTVYGPGEDYGITENSNNVVVDTKKNTSFHLGPINENDLVGTSQELIKSGTDYLSRIILSDAEVVAKESIEIYNRQIKPHLVKLNYIQKKLSRDDVQIDDEKRLFIELDVIAMEIKQITKEYETKQKKSFFKKIFGFGVKVAGEITSVALPYIIEQQKKKKD